jgi:hypothetical protein
MKSRILIVDDHPVFSMALATLLNQEEDFEVCGVVADIPSAKKVITTMNPDLLTIGITLAGDNIALALRNIQSGRIYAIAKTLAWQLGSVWAMARITISQNVLFSGGYHGIYSAVRFRAPHSGGSADSLASGYFNRF